MSQITVPYVCPTGVREIIPQSSGRRRQNSVITGYMDRHILDVPTRSSSVAMGDIQVPEPDFFQVVLLAQIKHEPDAVSVSIVRPRPCGIRLDWYGNVGIPIPCHGLIPGLSRRVDHVKRGGNVETRSRGSRDPGNLSSRTSHRRPQCDHETVVELDHLPEAVLGGEYVVDGCAKGELWNLVVADRRDVADFVYSQSASHIGAVDRDTDGSRLEDARPDVPDVELEEIEPVADRDVRVQGFEFPRLFDILPDTIHRGELVHDGRAKQELRVLLVADGRDTTVLVDAQSRRHIVTVQAEADCSRQKFTRPDVCDLELDEVEGGPDS